MKHDLMIPVRFMSRKALEETLKTMRLWACELQSEFAKKDFTFHEWEVMSREVCTLEKSIEAVENALKGVFRA